MRKDMNELREFAEEYRQRKVGEAQILALLEEP